MAPALPFGWSAPTLYLVVLLVGNKLLNDPDTYWHIVVGQWILAHGFPHADPFSFTFAGKPWIAKEWLSQLLYFGAFHGGMAGDGGPRGRGSRRWPSACSPTSLRSGWLRCR